MLEIDKATYDAIVAHARRDHPDEACGVVAGPVGSGRPERFIPMLNAARSPTFYEFDTHDLLRLYAAGQPVCGGSAAAVGLTPGTPVQEKDGTEAHD